MANIGITFFFLADASLSFGPEASVRLKASATRTGLVLHKNSALKK